jgi:hypothetical protein
MKILLLWKAFLAVVLASTICSAKDGSIVSDSTINTTSSAIAFANLDQQIHQAGNEIGVEELLLVRSRRAHLGRDGTRPVGSYCYALELATRCTGSPMLLPTLKQRSALELSRTR